MAFLAQSPVGATYVGQQWAHCLLLVSAEKTSRHLTIIAGETSKAAAAEQRKAPAPGIKG